MKLLPILAVILFLQSCSSEGGQFNRGYVISKTQWEHSSEENTAPVDEETEESATE